MKREKLYCKNVAVNVRCVCSLYVNSITATPIPGFPRSSREGVRLGRESANWTQINHIARQFRLEQFLDVSSDLHVGPSSRRAKVLHSCHLLGKPENKPLT